MRVSARWTLAALSVVSCCHAAHAHDLSTSESRLVVAGPTIRVRLSFDLLAVAGVDANGDKKVSYDELDQSIEAVFAVVKRHYRVTAGAEPSRITLERHDLADEHGVTMELLYTFAGPVRRVEVAETFHDIAAPSHQHLVSAVIAGELRRAMLSANYPSATFVVGGFTAGSAIAIAAAGLVVAGLVGYRITTAIRRSRNAPAP